MHSGIQKLFAFIIAIFSIFSSFAQCKKNEILVCHTIRASDWIGCCTVCRCEKIHGGNGHQVAGNTASSDLFSISVINSTAISVALAEPQTSSYAFDRPKRSMKIPVESIAKKSEFELSEIRLE